MNKIYRFLIVFIIAAAMFALTWKKESLGALARDSISEFGTVIATPSPVAQNTEKAPSMHNLVLVEFFAGY